MRLISVDALLKLAKLKEETDDPQTPAMIRMLLVPFEYTRIDNFVDIMFSAAKDVGEAAEEVSAEAEVHSAASDQVESHSMDIAAINAKREQLLSAASKTLGRALVKKTRATYWDPTHEVRVTCSISKAYPDNSIYRYWYAYHPAWDSFLAEAKDAYAIWGGLDIGFGFMVPQADLKAHLDKMNKTVRPDGKTYWHIKILEKVPGNYFLQLPLADDDLPLEKYKLPIISMPTG